MNPARLAIVLAGLLLFGAARLSFEQRLTADLRAAHFFQSQLNRSVREQAGYMGFVAALGGFRSAVADYAYISSYTDFAETAWGKLKFLLDVATTLRPRSTLFWDMAGWHMAWNASIGAMKDDTQPREALRRKASREYIKIGEEFYLRGIGFNPDHALLYKRLGDLYEQRLNDPCRASWAYFEAAKQPDCLGYVRRSAVYELAKCPGHEAETLRLLTALYHQGPQERLPLLLNLIDRLQKQLNVPEAERIDIRKDLEEATPGRKR